MDVGYVVVVPDAKPEKVKFPEPKLCAVGFVCPHPTWTWRTSRRVSAYVIKCRRKAGRTLVVEAAVMGTEGCSVKAERHGRLRAAEL
jgi:hypothetical protein